MTMTLNGSGTGTVGVPNIMTAQNASGTAVDFTGIPAGVRKITIIFNALSLNGSADFLVQIGSGSFTTTGYASIGNGYNQGAGTAGNTSTSGYVVYTANIAGSMSGHMLLTPVSGNTWVSSHCGTKGASLTVINGGGTGSLSGTLDRVRITTTNGTDIFDAGSINIIYE